MQTKPYIGLNAGVSMNDKGKHSYSIGGRYTNAVTKAGGIPVVLPATKEINIIEKYLDLINGLVLIGGPDLDPKLYSNEVKLPTTSKTPLLRQEFDLALARLALERDLPVMGICMGCQVLCVAAGGTLIQDIQYQVEGYSQRHYRKIAPYYPLHNIEIVPDSILHGIIGKTRLEVNSAHHQSVKTPPHGFRAVAFSEDKIIECIEHPKKRFALGIQWHPEAIHDRPEQLSLFKALVQASSGGDSS